MQPHCVGSAFKSELKVQWKAIWAKSPCRRKLAKIDNKMPSHSFIKATDQLTQAQASIIMQLQTGHVPLNGFLQRIGKVTSSKCPACPEVMETVHHFLFKCPAHAHAHHGMSRALGHKSKSLQHALGNQEAFKPVLKFIQVSGHFKLI